MWSSIIGTSFSIDVLFVSVSDCASSDDVTVSSFVVGSVVDSVATSVALSVLSFVTSDGASGAGSAAELFSSTGFSTGSDVGFVGSSFGSGFSLDFFETIDSSGSAMVILHRYLQAYLYMLL